MSEVALADFGPVWTGAGAAKVAGKIAQDGAWLFFLRPSGKYLSIFKGLGGRSFPKWPESEIE